MNKTISRRQKILRDSLVSHGKKRNKLILRAGSPEISNYGKASGETADTHAFHETDGYFAWGMQARSSKYEYTHEQAYSTRRPVQSA